MELTLTRREKGPGGEDIKYVFFANAAKRSWSVGISPRTDVTLENWWSNDRNGNVVSKFHCFIECNAQTNAWSVFDMSTHGTWVNGERAKARTCVPLVDGAVLRLGSATLPPDYELTKYDFVVSIAPIGGGGEGVCTRGKRKASWGPDAAEADAAGRRIGKAPKMDLLETSVEPQFTEEQKTAHQARLVHLESAKSELRHAENTLAELRTLLRNQTRLLRETVQRFSQTDTRPS